MLTWAPIRTPVPMTQLLSRAPAPTLTPSQRMAPSTRASSPRRHPSPTTASGPTRARAPTSVPAPTWLGPTIRASAARRAVGAIARRGQRRADALVQQVELGVAIGGRAADVPPVGLPGPAVGGNPVGDGRREELALDRHHLAGGDPVQQRGVDEVDPGVDRVGRDRLVRGRADH